jgi:hypothetical protein
LSPATLKVLIRLYFGERLHEFVNSLAVQHKKVRADDKKISLANFSFRTSLSPEGGVRPINKESQNGLENPKDRRSAGRHGNQHVCVRRPQVSGCNSFRFDEGGPTGVTRSCWRDRVGACVRLSSF